MVFDPNLTVTLGDEEEVGSFLALADYDVFWEVEESYYIVD